MTTESKADLAVLRGQEGMLCSQAVLSVFCDELGLELAPAMRLASGFGGGIGLSGETCGAAIGGVMALGLAYGPSGAAGQEAKIKVLLPANVFLKRFAAINGSARCRDILDGLDLAVPGNAASLRESPELLARCTACIGGAVRLVEEMLP